MRGAVNRQHVDITLVIAPVAPVVLDVPPVDPAAPVVPYPLVVQPRPDMWLKTFAQQRAPQFIGEGEDIEAWFR